MKYLTKEKSSITEEEELFSELFFEMSQEGYIDQGDQK
jgi:hypothetical protein